MRKQDKILQLISTELQKVKHCLRAVGYIRDIYTHKHQTCSIFSDYERKGNKLDSVVFYQFPGLRNIYVP